MQIELRDGTLHISGDVTVKTLTSAAFTRFRQQCRLKDTRAVDLSGVGRADSACVSLLLDALRSPNGKISLQGIPESVRTLSELYEIKDWLNP